MHKQVIDFLTTAKTEFPTLFIGRKVLEVGSLNINGTVRGFFENCDYTGIDLIEGKDVDIVCDFNDYKPDTLYDIVISCEMLEHDRNWRLSIPKMYELLKPLGVLIITCATTGRKEHGTFRSEPYSSPSTNNYYHNISYSEMKSIICELPHTYYELHENCESHDLYLILKKK